MRREPLAPAGRATFACLSALGGAFLWTFWIDYGLYARPIWPVLVLGLVSLAVAGLVATRIRWMLPLGALVGAGIFATALGEPFVVMRLTGAETPSAFLSAVMIVGFAAMAAGAGLVATVQVLRAPVTTG